MESLNLQVKDIIKETSDTITIVFNRPVGINFEAGQYLTLIIYFKIEGEQRRAYSLCSCPHEKNRLAVTVKRVKDGLVSNYLNDSCKIGDELKVIPPIGNFKLNIDKNREIHYVLITAGSGITPLMSMLKTIINIGSETKITLLYGNRTENSIIYKDELEEINRSYNNLKIIHTLSDADYTWTGKRGRISWDSISTIIDRNSDQKFYLCGPNKMMETATNVLNSNSISVNNIHQESFFADLTTIDNDILEDRKITLLINDKSIDILVKKGNTILESALSQNIDLNYSCESGVCTSCKGKKISGKLIMNDAKALTEDEIINNEILLCVSYPNSDNVSIKM